MASLCNNTSLFSCQQQDELQETSKEATNFSISIDDALSDPLTRELKSFFFSFY